MHSNLTYQRAVVISTFIRQQTGLTIDVAAQKRQWLRDAGAISDDEIVETDSTMIQRTRMSAVLERVGLGLVRDGVCTATQIEEYAAAMAEWAAVPEREMRIPCWDCLCFKG